MRFSEGPADPEALLGELAGRLEARREGRGAPPAAVGARARIVFAPEALDERERTALANASDVGLAPAAGGMARILVAPERLAELCARSPGARCLHAAVRAGATPPGARRLMGIVNVTPDSFSDGGAYLESRRALEHGLRLIEEGATDRKSACRERVWIRV